MKDATSPRAPLDPMPARALLDAPIERGPFAEAIAPQPHSAAEVESALPRDHPAWQRDGLVVSGRVRAILRTLQPVVIRVRTFWDHAVRRLSVRGSQLEIDPSGCYRVR